MAHPLVATSIFNRTAHLYAAHFFYHTLVQQSIRHSTPGCLDHSTLVAQAIALILMAVRAVFDFNSRRFSRSWLDRVLNPRMARWFTQGDQLGERAVQDGVPGTLRLTS